ncbi:uncharacterized protein LOC110901631 [Helianthus annuus]|uniref:uncharacterized protein LOC110901631 n=1 Tax=Helianthus annuus TaxID=4232 RepID=UPI000B8FB757|nr:uncharacterized protein LOC110901631 [Helianthus annuus]
MVGEWFKLEVSNVVRILRVFHVCSGLKINLDKSNIYGIGVGWDEIGDMAKEVGCNPDTTPFKYLGLKVGANMNRISNWLPVYEFFRARLAKWKSNLLSIGGRVVIIKSVLESWGFTSSELFKGEIGNGQTVTFWLDPWVCNEPLKNMFPDLFKLENNKKGVVADRIVNSGSGCMFQWSWREAVIEPGLVADFQQLQLLLENIQVSDAADRWSWKSDAAGKFSVKAVRLLIRAEVDISDRYIMNGVIGPLPR